MSDLQSPSTTISSTGSRNSRLVNSPQSASHQPGLELSRSASVHPILSNISQGSYSSQPNESSESLPMIQLESSASHLATLVSDSLNPQFLTSLNEPNNKNKLSDQQSTDSIHSDDQSVESTTIISKSSTNKISQKFLPASSTNFLQPFQEFIFLQNLQPSSSSLFHTPTLQYPSTAERLEHSALSRSMLTYPTGSTLNTRTNKGFSCHELQSEYNRQQYRSSTSFSSPDRTLGMSGGLCREGSADIGGFSGTSCSSGGHSGGSCSTGGATAHCWYSPSANGEPPGARAAHSADVIGGNRIYVFGGWNGKTAMNDLYVLEVEKMLWRKIQIKDPPPERNNHTTSVVGHRLLTHGGHDGTKWLDDLYVLDTESLTWTEVIVSGKLPTPRACHTLSTVNDKVYLFGGYDGQRCFNDIDILDLDTFSWIQPNVSGTLPQARNAHSMTVIESKLYLFGGHSGNKHLTDLHIFDTATLRWSQPVVLGMAPPGLRGHTATLIGDRMFLFGGYDGKGRSNNLYVLESMKLKWLHPQEPNGAPVGRQRHSACLVGAKRLFIFGGFDGTKWMNDLHILDVGRLTEDELTDTAVRSLIHNMRKLVGDPEFSDVTLNVDGRDIPAHRCILAGQCDYFRSMFSGQMKESREDKISIHGWSHDPYMAMLEFLYTGRLSEDRPMIICEVMGLADQYGLDALKTLCENILKHSVDHENVCSILKNSDKYQAIDLKNFCTQYIFHHPDEVLETKAFEELSNTPWLLMDITRLSLTSSSKHRRAFSSSTTSWIGSGTESSGGI